MSIVTCARVVVGAVLVVALVGCAASTTAPADTGPAEVTTTAGCPEGGWTWLCSTPADAETGESNACPDGYEAVFDEHQQIEFTSPYTHGVEPGSVCERQLERWARESADQLLDGLNEVCPSGDFETCLPDERHTGVGGSDG